MKIVIWPQDEDKDATTIECNSLQHLWDWVRTSPPVQEEGTDYIRELSANEEEDGTPYLVLSWVEVEALK